MDIVSSIIFLFFTRQFHMCVRSCV